MFNRPNVPNRYHLFNDLMDAPLVGMHFIGGFILGTALSTYGPAYPDHTRVERGLLRDSFRERGSSFFGILAALYNRDENRLPATLAVVVGFTLGFLAAQANLQLHEKVSHSMPRLI